MVRELPTTSRPADAGLWLGNQAVRVIEAQTRARDPAAQWPMLRTADCLASPITIAVRPGETVHLARLRLNAVRAWEWQQTGTDGA